LGLFTGTLPFLIHNEQCQSNTLIIYFISNILHKTADLQFDTLIHSIQYLMSVLSEVSFDFRVIICRETLKCPNIW